MYSLNDLKRQNCIFNLLIFGPPEILILATAGIFKAPGSDVFLYLKGKPLEDTPEDLITSPSDLDNHLSRVVSKILSCKNHPAELNPTAMAQQLEEAQV